MYPLLMFSFFLILTSFSNAAQVDPLQQIAKTTFESPVKGYSFDYPEDWQKVDIKGFDIVLKAPENQQGQSFANLSVISGPLPPNVDLEVYTRENVTHLVLNNEFIHNFDNGTAEIGGVPSNWISYNRGDDLTKIVQYFFVKDKLAYLITEGSMTASYDDYKETFDEIIKSFKFTN